jgi:hypothetical protein
LALFVFGSPEQAANRSLIWIGKVHTASGRATSNHFFRSDGQPPPPLKVDDALLRLKHIICFVNLKVDDGAGMISF